MTEKPCACDEARTATVEILGCYDGGLFFECQVCYVRWHRWPEGDWRRTQAERHIDRDLSPARLPGDAHGGA